MTLLGKKKLSEFARHHASAQPAIRAWVAEVEGSQWRTPQDVKNRYPSVSILPDNYFIFNIKGGQYRLEVQMAFNTGVVLVKRIGTHAEYNRWKH